MGQEVGNNQNGFRAIKRDLLKPFIEINNNRMASITELLSKAMEEKKKIIEGPFSIIQECLEVLMLNYLRSLFQ